MKSINKLTLTLIFMLSTLFFFSCKKKKKIIHIEQTPIEKTTIKAIPMPSKLTSGQDFPTDSIIINNWVSKSAIVENLETNQDIITHGWDIWDALTTYTNESNNGQKLRRFETWYTPGDIQTALKAKKSNSDYKLEDLDRSHTGHLKVPHQHQHGIEVQGADVVGFVKCDPSSANHIYDKELYYFEVLKSMIKEGEIANIPAFPNSSVLIKPVFYPLSSVNNLGSGDYSLPVWPGYKNQISMDSIIENGFGPDSWNNDITISTEGKRDVSKKIFPIDDFIHFKMDKEQAKSIVNVIDKGIAKEGDYAVLVGMHVNTRENKRWTWQTFWWSETPEVPQSPSSSLIASYKPASLNHAAKHYSMAVAYNMISPSQPYTGGSNTIAKNELKESIYAYNPYLEAGFSSKTFDITPYPKNDNTRSQSGGNDTIRKYYKEGYQRVGAYYKEEENKYIGGKLNRVGIETNCMSCHGQARLYDVPKIEDAFQYYVTDQYYEMDAPYFKNTVVLDFAWSIQGSLIYKDAVPE